MPSTQTAWGIDVGTTALKAIKVRREGEKVILEAMEVVDHSAYLSEPDVDRKEIVRESVAKFIEKHPLRGERVFISASGANSFARFVKLPPVEPRRIPEIVKFEAIQQIPFPLDQVIWDYHPFQSPESPDVEIGIFAIKTDILGALLGDFRALGVTVNGVQVAPLSVYNALLFEEKGKDKGTIVIDIGADHTDLIIVDQGRLWMRNINLGGNSFTESLAKTYRLQFRKSEELKKTAATNKFARQIFQALRPTFADIVAEIQRSVGYFNSSHRESRLEQIIGIGNSFRLPNLQKYLEQNLGMEVHRMDGFSKLEVPETRLAAASSEQALGMPVAYGLALQGVGLGTITTNLLPIEIARQMLWRKKTPWFAATAALFLLGTAAAGAKYMMDSSAYYNSMHAPAMTRDTMEISRVSSWQDQYTGINNTYHTNVGRINFFKGLMARRTIWPLIYRTFYTSLPQAQAAVSAKRPGWKIILQSIESTYESNLSPVPVTTGAAATTAAATPSGSGYRIVITGYTPYNPPLQILEHFRDAIRKAAGTKSKLPFYVVIPSGSLHEARISDVVGAGGGNASGLGFVPWGTARGPFSSAFLQDYLPKTKSTTPPAGAVNPAENGLPGGEPANFPPIFQGGFPGGGFPGGNFPGQGNMAGTTENRTLGVIDPNTRKSLLHATAFRMTFLVYLR